MLIKEDKFSFPPFTVARVIDTHAHLNFNIYKDDLDEVISHSLNNNIWLVNVGSQYSTSKRAVEIAKKYPEGIYAAIGLHPIHAADGFNHEKYKELAKSSRVVALGDIGLDYKSEYSSFKEKQKEVFLQQLALSKELDLPVILHCRMAHDDLIETLKGYADIKGVVHCFTGDLEQARKYLEMGFYLGFNGIIFKLDLDKIIEETPLEKILIETDCPYLTPPPMEGRNEPIYIKYVAEKIAKIKNISYQEISKITTENAKKLFNLF